ncbi:hypothetical protein FOA52_015112 [Chlamydomonas sp. UWO 241]|nr:hypothetical protein FOA52_015112 [Chlamydomonas sp. UWO 241]
MSGRGRGRGGFGGGRGGRGRGSGAPVGPVARDDDGTVLSSAPLGPPPMFPEIELPEHPEITAKESLLLLRRNDLLNYSKTSPFFLELVKQAKDGPNAGLDRFSMRDAKRLRTREPLTSVMTLTSEYFPEELFAGASEKRGKLHSQKQDAFWKAQGKKNDESGGLHRLDQLAQMEGKAGAAGGPGAAGGDDEPPEDLAPVDTDEEEDMEFDDYYQGEDFQDDEGYDDAYEDGGGGGDEGATY